MALILRFGRIIAIYTTCTRQLCESISDTREITNITLGGTSCEMNDLTAFQCDLLYVIAVSDHSSGQDIKADVQQYYSSEINHGRLYPNLDSLVNKELVEKGEVDRRTNYYDLNDSGAEIIENRREWESQYVD